MSAPDPDRWKGCGIVIAVPLAGILGIVSTILYYKLVMS